MTEILERAYAEVIAENAKLRALLQSLEWKSINKDNMEFRCVTSYYVMDQIRAALANEQDKRGNVPIWDTNKLQDEIARLKLSIAALKSECRGRAENEDRLTAEVGTLESRLADEQTASHEYMKLIIRLQSVLGEFLSYKWKSADKDNMEFTATVARFTLDMARAALADEQEK